MWKYYVFYLKVLLQGSKLLGERVKAERSQYLLPANDSFYYCVIKPKRTWSQDIYNEYNSSVDIQELNILITIL